MQQGSGDGIGHQQSSLQEKRVQIPSFREVQQAQRNPAVMPNFFQPSITGPAPIIPQQHHLQDRNIQPYTQPTPPLPAPVYQPQHFQQQRPLQHAPPPPNNSINNTINPNIITVSRRQQGNPVLKYIRNVRWQFGDILPDYLLGQSTAALFLSLRYHLLKPEYIHSRMKELGKSYRMRVLLVHVDTEDAVQPLSQVTKTAIANEYTLLCGFSNPECARYLETLKSYEKKPAEIIQKDVGTDYISRATAALTVVRGVNRTDVKTLGDAFGSMEALFQASESELKQCVGVGAVKARRLHDTFYQPFRRNLLVDNGGTIQGRGAPERHVILGDDRDDDDDENNNNNDDERDHDGSGTFVL